MTRIGIYRGERKNSRTFRGRVSGFTFSVESTDWELYLEKFFRAEDCWYTEKEWGTILENINREKETLISSWENITGRTWLGESWSSMVSFDRPGRKEDAAEYEGLSSLLHGIIVFYERFLLFSEAVTAPSTTDLVLSRAA